MSSAITASSVPARHPAAPVKVPGLRPFALLMGIGKPDAEQWRLMGEDLLVGDEPMDTLVDWMYTTGMTETRPLFQRALESGIDSVPDAPEPLRAFFTLVETPPDWLDESLVRRGEQTLRMGGYDGLYLARDVSFLGGYLASGFNKTLLRTGALEKGPAQRFAETMQWALDVQKGMQKFGPGYRSTLHVRFVHSLVRRHVGAMPDWDTDAWGLPINQTDMAATLVGALIAPFVGGIAMGIIPSRADREAAAHLARYVGWLMGVEEKWLPTGFRDSVRILYHCMTAITNPDETTRQLAVPMANDPLNWHYPNLPRLRGRIARAQHLSISTMYLGPKAMRQLGIRPYMPPWYPLLRIPINLTRSIANHLVPGARLRAERRGLREQEAFQRRLVGSGTAAVGQSAQHLQDTA
ncbi:oxygenase MpaB family protein [Nocardia paucivorans]|uniref:oxygenase MpaB family protein n=1 Tax=Nocardia paucivorans TaxID=114259 RepID=UPI0003176387|nr:oxygenase MpaB family protein [Nocardia paucivorans]